MKHISKYAKSRLVDEMLSEMEHLPVMEVLDDLKYSVDRIKSKWNKFWGWVFGDSNFSSDYSDDDLEDMLDDDETEYELKWVKVDSSYKKNLDQASKLLEDSKESSGKGFWRTAKLIESSNKKLSNYKVVLGILSFEEEDEEEKVVAIMALVEPKLVENDGKKTMKVVSVEVVRGCAKKIDWKDIFDYLKSKELMKGWFDKVASIEVNLHKDMEKLAAKSIDEDGEESEIDGNTVFTHKIEASK